MSSLPQTKSLGRDNEEITAVISHPKCFTLAKVSNGKNFAKNSNENWAKIKTLNIILLLPSTGPLHNSF